MKLIALLIVMSCTSTTSPPEVPRVIDKSPAKYEGDCIYRISGANPLEGVDITIQARCTRYEVGDEYDGPVR